MYTVETVPCGRARQYFRDDITRFAFDYWDRIRQGRKVPDRRDIEPADVAPVLGNLMLLETFAGSVSFRLAGTRFTNQLGRETRGASAATIWRGADRGRFEAIIRTLADLPGGAVLAADLITQDQPPTPFELLLLPLTFRGPDVCRFLGTATALRNDYWLGCEPPLGFEMREIVLFETGSSSGRQTAQPATLPVRIHRHLALYQGGANS